MLSGSKSLAIISIFIVGYLLFKYLSPSESSGDSNTVLFWMSNGAYVVYMCVIILLVIMLIKLEGLDMTPEKHRELDQVITIEGLTNLDRKRGFCKNNQTDAAKLEKGCNNLSRDNCNTVNCCVYLNGSKCVAGDKTGPTFSTDNSGKTVDVDTYYFRNKCHGPGC